MELKIPTHLSKKKNESSGDGKGKTMRASKGVKYVLFLGDEGAILLYIKGNNVQSRQFVPDASEQHLKELQQTLAKDTHAPLLLVVDSMDQSFMQQTLPPVSIISVNKLIKRRLERDFAGNDIKGAILLGREKTGRRDWNFLMVALEKSPQLTVWLGFIRDLPNRFLGVYLASVEAELLIKRLERAMGNGSSNDDAEWKFFVSHNKVGGFRQVILKNGRIIFTRLAQPVGESNAEVIAGGIEQEMLSTIEYMKRLSYSPQNKLDIYIVTSSSIKSVIDQSKFSANSFHVLTPYEVAGYLGIEGAAQPTDQFGDVVMAASVGISKRHVLKLTAPQTKKVDNFYQIVTYQRALTSMAVLGIVGYAGYVAYGIYDLIEESDTLAIKRDSMQRDLDLLRKNIQDSNIDVEGASDLIDLYQQINREKASPLPFLRKFEALSRAPVWVKSFDWSLDSTAPSKGARGEPQKGELPMITTKLLLEFPQEASDPKFFRPLSKKILEDFQQQFEGYDVQYVNLPTDIKTETLEIRSGLKPDEVIRSLDVQMIIKGPLALPAVVTPPIGEQVPAISVPPTATP